MTPFRYSQVLVLLLSSLLANAQNLNYPYPYNQQQYPNVGGDVNNFGAQGYPQVFIPNYPNPNPYQGYYPMYPPAPQYPIYPSYPPVSYPGNLPGGYPDQQYPGLSQYPPGTNIFPFNQQIPTPQSIQTPYGNIPVEIIDVDENGTVDTNRQIINSTDDETKFTPVLSESKSVFDVSSTPTRNTKFVKTEPSQTKIVRTFDPKGQIHVEIQTPGPITNKNRNNNKEDNDDDNHITTTKKWGLFG